MTSATDPDTPLDGPFASYEECGRRCLTRTDRGTVLAHFLARRLPAYYVPRQFEIRETEVLHYKWADEPPRAAPAPARTGPVLPDVVYTYTRAQLLTLCKGLELQPPSHTADRARIIEHMEKQLRALARGSARDSP